VPAEAFLWEQRRTVTKTATVSLHGNIYQVDRCSPDAAWSGCLTRST
jgi:hypothetical protein